MCCIACLVVNAPEYCYVGIGRCWRLGGGGTVYNCAQSVHEIFWIPPTFHWNHAHLTLVMLLDHCGKSFFGCSKEDMNGRLTTTDFVHTYSWNFIWYLIIRLITAWTGIALAMGALPTPPPPFPAGWGGGGTRASPPCSYAYVATSNGSPPTSLSLM